MLVKGVWNGYGTHNFPSEDIAISEKALPISRGQRGEGKRSIASSHDGVRCERAHLRTDLAIPPRPHHATSRRRAAAYYCEHISGCSEKLVHSLTLTFDCLTLRQCPRSPSPRQAPAPTCRPRLPQLVNGPPTTFPPPARVDRRPQVSIVKRRPQVDRPQARGPLPQVKFPSCKTAQRQETRWKGSQS